MLYIILILTFLGMVDALVIYYKNSKPGPVACPLHGDCSAVLKSKYSKLFGVKNEIWGFLFYLTLFIFVLLSVFNTYFLGFMNYVVLASGFGVLYSLYLIYLQVFKIKQSCFYCLLSSLDTVLIFCALLIWIK